MRKNSQEIKKEINELISYLSFDLSETCIDSTKPLYLVSSYATQYSCSPHRVWFVTNFSGEAKDRALMLLEYLHLLYYGRKKFPFDVTISRADAVDDILCIKLTQSLNGRKRWRN